MELFILFLLLTPLAIQIIFGVKALKDRITLSFTEICLISVISNIIVVPVSLFINFEFNVPNDHHPNCGLPGAGLVLLGLLLFIILVITIVIQHLAMRYEK